MWEFANSMLGASIALSGGAEELLCAYIMRPSRAEALLTGLLDPQAFKGDKVLGSLCLFFVDHV